MGIPVAELKGEAKARFVAGMFARIAGRYDLLNTVMTGGMHHRWRRLATRLVSEGLHGPALDVATGTGDFAFALAKQPGIQEVVGADIVGPMLEVAGRKAKQRKLERRVSFLQADVLALPFPDDTFACATAGFAVRNVTDVLAAISEMARVVQPGGRVAILEILPVKTRGPISQAMRLYFRRVVPLLGRVLTGDQQAYTYLPDSVDAFLAVHELAGVMENAGLRIVRSRTVGMGTVGILVGEKG